MRLEQFGQVIELVKTGSFSQTARNLYISQPSLSHSIKQLEKELGFSLFVRTSDGVIPTPQGRDVIEHFKIIHRESCSLREYCQNSEQAPRVSLRIATRNLNRTNQAFYDIVKRHMGAPIDFSFLHYTTIDQMIDMVSACQVDFALIGTLSPYTKALMARLQNNNIEYYKISEGPISAIVGPQNPLYQEESATLQELYPFTLVSYSNNNEDPSFSLPHVTGLNRHAFGHVRVNSSQLFYSIVQTTPAVGLLVHDAESFKRFNDQKDVRLLPLSDCDVGAEYGWIKLRRLPLSDIAAELLDSVRALL